MSDNSVINKYQVNNLTGFTTYNFTLRVCTSKCSGFSKPVLIQTLVGVPGKMMKPQVSLINPTMVDVSWTPPVPSAGSLDFYQILIGASEDSAESEIFNVTGENISINLILIIKI